MTAVLQQVRAYVVMRTMAVPMNTPRPAMRTRAVPQRVRGIVIEDEEDICTRYCLSEWCGEDSEAPDGGCLCIRSFLFYLIFYSEGTCGGELRKRTGVPNT